MASFTEADEAFRRAEREKNQGGDPSGYYTQLRRQGPGAVKSHFAGHAKEFMASLKDHYDASDHWHTLRNSFDNDARKKADESLKTAADRFHAAHKTFADAVHHYGRSSGQQDHPTLHLHRGDAPLEDHMHALSHLSGVYGRPTIDHSTKATHVTVSQRQDSAMPFGFKGVDEFVRGVRHHYQKQPTVQKSGSTALVHVKLPLEKPKLKLTSKDEDLMLTRTPLQEEQDKKNEAKDVNKEVGQHCGVFIPLPYNLAKEFPDKSTHDSSVPHFTILYVGECSPDAYKILCKIVSDVAMKLKPFQLDLEHYGEFTSHNGLKIAHMVPSMIGQLRLAALHGIIRRAIEQFGAEIKVQHNYGNNAAPKLGYEGQFLSHATLAYLSPEVPYTGPKPTGSWRVTEIECWGHEKARIPLGRTKIEQPTGLTRDPLSIDYPMAVPNVVTGEKDDRASPDVVKIKVQGTKIKFEWKDKIPGGRADKAKPEDFDPEQLAMGIKVEKEHTNDVHMAREIAMDHLRERKDYYTKLKKIDPHHEDTGTMPSEGGIGLAGSLPHLEAQKRIDKLRREKLRGLA